jgi:hypothetical protein
VSVGFVLASGLIVVSWVSGFGIWGGDRASDFDLVRVRGAIVTANTRRRWKGGPNT